MSLTAQAPRGGRSRAYSLARRRLNRGAMSMRLRPRQLIIAVFGFIILVCLLSLFHLQSSRSDPQTSRFGETVGTFGGGNGRDGNTGMGGSSSSRSSSNGDVSGDFDSDFSDDWQARGTGSSDSRLSSTDPTAPQPQPAPAGSHPIWHLITDAEREWEKVLSRQSKTLDEAVAEYRRRYQIPPPPNFDKWFAFAKNKDVQLVDEFDTIHESIKPFWGMKPTTIRQRAQEALGYDNALLGILIRQGKASHVQGGGEWQREATVGMMGKFMQYLPDMDLCFNLHDEPRVVVPHDDLARLVRRAVDVNMPAANGATQVVNKFTSRPKGLSPGGRFIESKLTRFNFFAHQPTWTHSRLSCPPDSPARGLEEEERRDDVSKYGTGALGFIHNVTAMQDICNSPSLSSTFGFFDRPNAYNIVHDLFPIFSQSKISSYSDILYPSPWYWYQKVSYDKSKDFAWTKKQDDFYWRGSTTGGFSRNGGWRRQHRQRLVQKINAADVAQILVNRGTDTNPQWEPREVDRRRFKDLVDIHFSHIGQCDQGDCDAQREFFEVKKKAEQQDAWRYKYLLDMDGNAFSGRFYAFLKSKSLVFKWAIFKEWHLEWLRPWAHYLPLSLQGDDWLEAVRFFHEERLGKEQAERLAMQQQDWADKVLRNEDMEVWFFRLLLEYGRVIDDNRESIGFSTRRSWSMKTPVKAQVQQMPAQPPVPPPAQIPAQQQQQQPPGQLPGQPLGFLPGQVAGRAPDQPSANVPSDTGLSQALIGADTLGGGVAAAPVIMAKGRTASDPGLDPRVPP